MATKKWHRYNYYKPRLQLSTGDLGLGRGPGDGVVIPETDMGGGHPLSGLPSRPLFLCHFLGARSIRQLPTAKPSTHKGRGFDGERV